MQPSMKSAAKRQVGIRLLPGTHMALKVTAAGVGITMEDAIDQAIRDWVKPRRGYLTIVKSTSDE